VTEGTIFTMDVMFLWLCQLLSNHTVYIT